MPRSLHRRSLLAIAGGAASLALAAPRLVLAATTHDIEMLNQHPDEPRQRMVFHPRIQVVQPGDTVRFVPVDRTHNSETTEGMLPEGAEGWKGKINEEVTATLEVPGFYGYQCTPHLTLGMVGLVVVEGDGMTDNLAAAQDVRHRGKAAALWEEIWAEVSEMGLTS